MTHNWQGLFIHFGQFVFINIVLAMLSLFFFSGYLLIWFALGWGVILYLHLAHILVDYASEEKERLFNETLQRQMDMATRYKREIDDVVKTIPNRTSEGGLQHLSKKLTHWLQAIARLAQSVDKFEKMDVIQQDLVRLPQIIQELEARLAKEEEAATRHELKQTQVILESQWDNLYQLKCMIQRSETKIERAVSFLGTIYSQLLMAYHLQDYSSIERLLTEMDEEIRLLQDHQEALEEVKLAGQNGRAARADVGITYSLFDEY